MLPISWNDSFKDVRVTQDWPIAECEPKGLWDTSGTGRPYSPVLGGAEAAPYSDFFHFLSEPCRSGG